MSAEEWDDAVVIMLTLAGAVCAGLWQHSFYAGIAALALLLTLSRIEGNLARIDQALRRPK